MSDEARYCSPCSSALVVRLPSSHQYESLAICRRSKRRHSNLGHRVPRMPASETVHAIRLGSSCFASAAWISGTSRSCHLLFQGLSPLAVVQVIDVVAGFFLLARLLESRNALNSSRLIDSPRRFSPVEPSALITQRRSEWPSLPRNKQSRLRFPRMRCWYLCECISPGTCRDGVSGSREHGIGVFGARLQL